MHRQKAILFGLALAGLSLGVVLADGAGPAPVDLGRTTLASVRASSVNGGRGQGNPYYGIPNAFDDGRHVIHGIHYTEWLPDSTPPQWVEICFERPVTVAKVEADYTGDVFAPIPTELRGEPASAPPVDRSAPDPQKTPAAGRCRASLYDPAGKLLFQADFEGTRLLFPAAIENVGRIRLTFQVFNLHVADIRILGHIPATVAWQESNPRFDADPRDAEEYGRIVFDDWFDALKGKITTRREDLGEVFSIIFESDGVILFQADIDKRTLRVLRTAPQARWSPSPAPATAGRE